MAALPWEATVATVASSCKIWMFPGTPLRESCKESSSAIFKLRDQKMLAKLSTDIPQMRREIKRACNGSNKQETLEGVWLVTSVD
jgi:hypothetical protein